MKKWLFSGLLLISMLGLLIGCTSPQTKEKNGEKSPEDYELTVWQTFWETASEYFGVEYSSYKVAQTAYGYICENETSDGYISYYYLVKTAYETQNAFGQTISHPVTARCYVVPEYSNKVYITYITRDGETVYFDEETEDWLLGIGSKETEGTEEISQN